jgi:hypothetical protein
VTVLGAARVKRNWPAAKPAQVVTLRESEPGVYVRRAATG